METMMTASSIVSGANIIVVGTLIIVFSKIYSKTKAQLSLGMIFFTGLLALHNIIRIYLYLSMTDLYAAVLLPYLLVVYTTELTSVLILLG
jgi:hypothetical protein